MAEFQEFPKMLYHDKKAPQVVKSAEEESKLKGQGFKTQAPAQFPDESAEDAAANPVGHQNADPLREPAIVSQIDQEKTRLAGNQGAKDPAEFLRENDENDGENGFEDPEPTPAPAPKKKAGK
jgi:hypothetical protein